MVQCYTITILQFLNIENFLNLLSKISAELALACTTTYHALFSFILKSLCLLHH